MLISRLTLLQDRAGFAAWPLRVAYRLYEWRLMREVRRNSMPRHIGIILDGNRRYGELQRIKDARVLYGLGADKLDDVLEWCGELGISAVTLWAFSTDNERRAANEVSGILAAIEDKLRRFAEDTSTHHRRVRVRVVGQIDRLPPSLVAAIGAAEAATAGFDRTCLTIAVAYGGRDEIADAVRSLLRARLARGERLEHAVETITAAEIGRYLYTADLPDPDLIIRTSGEARLSGFLLWQSAYSEFYFSDVYWPAYRRIDFLRAIRAYQQRHRRFGL
ncbi:MAG TPA: polyprenyl diphosphate synthase [Stellaceae bacterium]|nr:polyprenyl diphosphate synthase [Stellaceae bacterium]